MTILPALTSAIARSPYAATEQRSTIISTNLAFKQWGTVFPGAACVVALVDRFAQHCHPVDILGLSCRDQHRLDPDGRPPPPPGRPRRRRPKS